MKIQESKERLTRPFVISRRALAEHVNVSCAAFALLLGSATPAVVAAADENHLPAGTVLIGVSLPLTGSRFELGDSLRDGVMAAIESVNLKTRHGVAKVSAQILDDHGDMALYEKNLRSLAAQRDVVALAVCWNDATCQIADKVASEAEIAVVGGISGLAPATKGGRTPLRGTYVDEFKAISHHALALSVHRLVLVSDGMPAQVVDLLKQQTVPRGVTLMVASVAQIQQQNLAASAAGWTAFVVGGELRDGAEVVPALRRVVGQSPIYALSSVNALALARQLRQGAAGLVVAVHAPNPEVPSNVQVREFLQDLDRVGAGSLIQHEQLEAWQAIRLVERLLRPGGPTASRMLLREELQAWKAGRFEPRSGEIASAPTRASGDVTLAVVTADGLIQQ